MPAQLERISAITLRVKDMDASLRFYCGLLGMQLIYGGANSPLSSLRTRELDSPILNLEHGKTTRGWGRMIFHVSDVDEFWRYLESHGFHPKPPQDAAWGERYFHVCDPDGHELSLARPLQP